MLTDAAIASLPFFAHRRTRRTGSRRNYRKSMTLRRCKHTEHFCPFITHSNSMSPHNAPRNMLNLQ